MASIAGTVTYRQRIALPEGAVVRVRLEELPRQDAESTVLAEAEIVTRGEQVPIPFALEHGDAVLDPRGRYVLRAAIEVGGEVRFATAAHQEVLTDGGASAIELVVEPAATRAPTLGDTRWTLVELGGRPVETGPGEGAPHLDFDEGRVAGSGGCNRLTGSYETTGCELRFGPLATTLMACPEPVLSREAAFLDALAKTTACELVGDGLALFGGGRVLARFSAAGR